MSNLYLPILFCSSVQAGSGKSSLVANLAVYLSSIGRRVAIVDLDGKSPLKLKRSFFIRLNEYDDLSYLAGNDNSRYQKSFYFTDSTEISYFPAHKINDISLLFSDSSLRDFFLQARACYDLIIVNFPSGREFCSIAAAMSSKRSNWYDKQPALVIFSNSDFTSLCYLDDLLISISSLQHQLRHNAMLVFNKVPKKDQIDHNDEILSADELLEIFNYPFVHISGMNDEFLRQRLESRPIVLDSTSLMHHSTSSMYRILGSLGKDNTELSTDHESYNVCLDGPLLEKLAPYIYSIGKAASSRLLLNQDDIHVFIEENPSGFRVRVRVSGQSSPIIGIATELKDYSYVSDFSQSLQTSFKHSEKYGKVKIMHGLDLCPRPQLSQKRVYRFDDRQLWEHLFSDIKTCIDIKFQPEVFASPKAFDYDYKLRDIPTLSHMLGYYGYSRGYSAPDYYVRENFYDQLSSFFIPDCFKLYETNICILDDNYKTSLIKSSEFALCSELKMCRQDYISSVQYKLETDIEDLFCRQQELIFTEMTLVGCEFEYQNYFCRVFSEEFFKADEYYLLRQELCETELEVPEIQKLCESPRIFLSLSPTYPNVNLSFKMIFENKQFVEHKYEIACSKLLIKPLPVEREQHMVVCSSNTSSMGYEGKLGVIKQLIFFDYCASFKHIKNEYNVFCIEPLIDHGQYLESEIEILFNKEILKKKLMPLFHSDISCILSLGSCREITKDSFYKNLFSYRTFFKQSLIDPELKITRNSCYESHKSFNCKFFDKSSKDHVSAFYSSMNIAKAISDILPVNFAFHKTKSYKTDSIISSTRSKRRIVCIESSSLKPHKTNMLSIVFKKIDNFRSLSYRRYKFCPSVSVRDDWNIGGCVDADNSFVIVTSVSKFVPNNFECSNVRTVWTGGFISAGKKQNYCLSFTTSQQINPIMSYSIRPAAVPDFYKPGVGNKIFESIWSLHQRNAGFLFESNTAKYGFTYDLDILLPEILLRHRSIESLCFVGRSKDRLKAIDNKADIFANKSGLSIFYQSKKQLKTKFGIFGTNIKSHSFIYKASKNVFKNFSISHNFKVKKPDPLQELYEHLKHILVYNYSRPFDLKIPNWSVEKSRNCLRLNLVYFSKTTSKKSFSESGRFVMGDLKMPLDNNGFKISYSGIRDFISIARQASRKITEFKSQLKK